MHNGHLTSSLLSRWLQTLALLLCLVLLWGCNSTVQRPVFHAQNGQLDLRSWSLNQHPVIELGGEWEIDWPYSQRIQVPQKWESVIDETYQQRAQYRLQMQLPPEALQQPLLIYLPQSGPHLSVWANGQLVTQSGLKLNPQRHSSSRTQSAEAFYPQSSELTLRILMINAGEHSSGLISPVQLGRASPLRQQLQQGQFVLSLILGATLIFILYHLFLFSQRPSETVLFYFALSSVVAFFYIDAFHAHTLEYLFVEWPLALSLRVTRFCLYSFLLVSIVYTEKALSVRYFRSFHILNTLMSSLLLLSLALPLPISNWVFFHCYFPWVSFHIGVSFVIIFKAWRRRQPGVKLFIASGTIFVLCCFFDVLVDIHLLQATYLVPWGYFAFCLGQATLLSQRFQEDFVQVKDLSQALQRSNLELEDRVTERTQELTAKSQELESLLDFKEQIMRMLAHDLKNPLHVILNSTTPSQKFKTSELRHIHRAAQDMDQLVQHLLEMKDLQAPQLPVQIEAIQVQQSLKQALDSLEPWLTPLQIRIINELPRQLEVMADAHLLVRVFQNVLSNAIKSVNAQGVIQISSHLQAQELILKIEDNGKGLDESFVDEAFDMFSSRFSNPDLPSNGLGLPFCKLAMESMGGRMSLQNTAQGALAQLHFQSQTRLQLFDFELALSSLTEAEYEALESALPRLENLAFYEISSLLKALDALGEIVSLQPLASLMQEAVEDFNEAQYTHYLKGLKHAVTHR